MKKLSLIFFGLALGVCVRAQSQSVGIGTINPDASAQLDVTSTNKGLLAPRMSQSQRNAIGSPATGLTIYNTSTNNLEVNVGTPSSPVWIAATSNRPATDSLVNGTPSGFTGRSGVLYTDTATGSPTIGNQWVWDGTGNFVSYTPANATAFYNQGGVGDAGANKNTTIYRKGPVGLGSNTTPDQSAQLDVNSTSRGFLPPRMTLAQMKAINSPADGLMVFCTDCNPRGTYQYDSTTGTQTPGWVSIGSSSLPDATYGASSLNCSNGALSGTYQQGLATTGSNTKVITINALTGGKYSATTNTVNGVSFSASGTLLSIGANSPITLKATGTPLNSGSFTYTVSLGGQTCTFSVTFTGPATFGCSGTVASNLSPYTDVLTNGQAYTGTVTVPYTAGNGQAYGSTTLTQSGLTLTRVAGTYNAGGGNIIYNLTGTYTGATGPNAVIFNLPEGCTVQFNGLQYSTAANAGTDVYFENLKVTVPTSGNRSMQFGTVGATIPVEFNTYYHSANGEQSNGTAQTATLNNSYVYIANWHFGNVGDYQFAYVRNTANNRVYKLSMVVGYQYNNNLVRIERVDTTASPARVKTAIVPAGTAVTLDNISVKKPTAGFNTMNISTVSGSITASWSSQRGQSFNSGYEQSSPYTNQSLTTSPVYAEPNWSMNGGDYNQAYIYDTTNGKFYKVELQSSLGFTNNLIRIERIDSLNLSYRKGVMLNGGGSITINNITASIPSSGPVNVQLATTSGSTAAYGIGITQNTGYSGVVVYPPVSITTAPTYWAVNGWDSGSIGDPRLGFIYDTNAGIWYRTLVLGAINGGQKRLLTFERY